MRLTEKDVEELQKQGRKVTGAVSNGPESENAPLNPSDTRNNGQNAGLRKMQALGRLKSGELNKTEQEYDQELKLQLTAGAIVWFKWHCLNLRLADGLFYRPDVLVMNPSMQLEVHEVKGWWTDDAVAKIKVAANQFPFRFMAVSKAAKKDGGGWKIKEFT